MFKQAALAFALIAGLTIIATGQPINPGGNSFEKPGKPAISNEATRALQRLGSLSSAETRSRLKQMRQHHSLPTPLLINKIINDQGLVIAEDKRTKQLKTDLQPVLDYHERGDLPVYVVKSEDSRAFVVARLALFITTRLLLSATVKELRGIVAHELAHDYVWDERNNALKANNGKLVWECELFCDAVAIFTLKEIGDDPANFRLSLERLAAVGIQSGRDIRAAADTHPSLSTRLELTKFLCQRLESSSAFN